MSLTSFGLRGFGGAPTACGAGTRATRWVGTWAIEPPFGTFDTGRSIGAGDAARSGGTCPTAVGRVVFTP